MIYIVPLIKDPTFLEKQLLEKMSNTKKIQMGRYTIKIPNWDKVLFPKLGLKKSDLIKYYSEISNYMLPFLKWYPLTLHRFPDGIEKKGFYQKQFQDYYPEYLKSVEIALVEGGTQKQVTCHKKSDLIYLAGQGTITFHLWLSKVTLIEKPTRIVFDLDPSDKADNFNHLITACYEIKKFFSKLNFMTYVMTTGSRGLHVIIPIKPFHSFDKLHAISHKIANYIAAQHPHMFTTELRKAKRKNRVFIDYTRNAYGQTSVAPYSLRALEKAPIATPLSWDELENLHSSQDYTIANISKRLSTIEDPWKDFQKQKSYFKQKELAEIDKITLTFSGKAS